MRILRSVERIPGGLMIVPLLLGAVVNTVDGMHPAPLQALLAALGQPPDAEGHRSLFAIGGFTEALFKKGTLALIGLFLFCAASQMDLRVGGRALKKGILLTGGKFAVALLLAYLFGRLFDPFRGPLGLSALVLLAAVSNSNGGLYAALVGQYGNRSDLGALAALSLNDGPFLTLVGLALLGVVGVTNAAFPGIAFVAVLLPIGLGMLLGNADPDVRAFLRPGEALTIPFFAFSLGAGMDLLDFFRPGVVLAGVILGLLTLVCTAGAGILLLALAGERSRIAGVAEGSTAGNAAGTPAAVAAAAATAAQAGLMDRTVAARYVQIVATSTAQISIATLTTALLCPLAVVLWNGVQTRRGIDGRAEPRV